MDTPHKATDATRKNELTEEVKARVPLAMKEQLEAIATNRMLSVSDVLREAVQLYLRANPEAKGEQAA